MVAQRKHWDPLVILVIPDPFHRIEVSRDQLLTDVPPQLYQVSCRVRDSERGNCGDNNVDEHGQKSHSCNPNLLCTVCARGLVVLPIPNRGLRQKATRPVTHHTTARVITDQVA